MSLSRKAEEVVATAQHCFLQTLFEAVLILVSTALSYFSFPIYLNYSLKYCATAQLRNHTHTRVIYVLKLHNTALNKICPFLFSFPIYLHYSLKYCATAQLRNHTHTKVIYVLKRHIQMIGLVNGKKQTKMLRQLLKIFFIPDFSKL